MAARSSFRKIFSVIFLFDFWFVNFPFFCHHRPLPFVTRQLPIFFPFPSVRGSQWLAVFHKRLFLHTSLWLSVAIRYQSSFSAIFPVVTTAFHYGPCFSIYLLPLTFLYKKEWYWACLACKGVLSLPSLALCIKWY